MSLASSEIDVNVGATVVSMSELGQHKAFVRAFSAAAQDVDANRPRSAADKYLRAFKKARVWRGRYFLLSGYSDMLINPRTQHITEEKDLEALLAITKDKDSLVAERMLAYFTRGLKFWDNSDRSEAVRMYQKALKLSADASAADRETLIWFSSIDHEGLSAIFQQKAGKLIDNHAANCRSNIALMNGTGSFENLTPNDLSMGKSMTWPVASSSPAEAAVQQNKMNNASRVRRNECAQCGVSHSAAGVDLKVCARCGLVWYCSQEHQKMHWKAAHKHQCREPKDFRAGDIVRLSDLEEHESPLQDHFFLVVGPDSSIQEGWKVANDQLLPAGGKVVPASKMQRVLTE